MTDTLTQQTILTELTTPDMTTSPVQVNNTSGSTGTTSGTAGTQSASASSADTAGTTQSSSTDASSSADTTTQGTASSTSKTGTTSSGTTGGKSSQSQVGHAVSSAAPTGSSNTASSGNPTGGDSTPSDPNKQTDTTASLLGTSALVAQPTFSAGLKMDTGVSATDGYTSVDVITGKAAANSVVSFTVDGKTVSTTVTADANGNWTFRPVSLADGTHAIVASSTDSFGNPLSATVNFTLDTKAPAVTEGLAHDTGLSSTDNYTSNPTVTGVGDANASLSFKVDGKMVAATAIADATGKWSFTPTGLADGTHTVEVFETDAAGNASMAAYTFTLDTTPPAVAAALTVDSGISATDGYTNNPAISGKTEPNLVVTFTIDGQAITQTVTADANGNWSFTPTGLTDGAHTIVASSADRAGNIGSATVAFTLDTTPPAVTEALLQDTGASQTDNYTSKSAVTGKGDANAVVHFAVDGAAVTTTAVADANGTWIFNPAGLADGTHTIVATETDAAGNTGSASLSFTLDTVAPVVNEALANDTGISNTDRLTNDPTLSGTVDVKDAGSLVTFTVDGKAIAGTATPDANGNWTFKPTGLADGQHTIVASVTDLAGNVGSSTLIFTLDTTPPVVAITSTAGAVNQAISGTSEAGAVVNAYEGTTLIGTTTVASDGTWSINDTFAKGDHYITATATDAAGNATTTAVTDYKAYSEVFTNAAGGDWNTGSNWQSGNAPADGDFAYIGQPVTVTENGWNNWYRGIARLDTVAGSTLLATDGGIHVTGASNIQGAVNLNSALFVNDANVSVAALTLAASKGNAFGAQLIDNGTSVTTVTSTLNFTQGEMWGTGKAVVAAGATATIGNGNEYLGEELHIAGSASVANANLYFGSYQGTTRYAGNLIVDAGGSLSIDDQSQIGLANSGFSDSGITNNGTVTKTGSGTTGLFSVPIANNGTLNVTSGTLDLSSSSVTNAGTLNVSGGATVSGDTVTTIDNTGTMALSQNAWVNTNVEKNTGTIALDNSQLSLTNDTTNTGTITAGEQSGVFALGRLIGGGAVNLAGDGSYVEVNGATDNTFNFSGTSADLKIDNSASFGGTINGFNATSMIDLADVIAGYTRMSYVQGENGGVLSVTDGTHTANLAVAGANQLSSFDVVADKSGGTAIVHA